MEWEGPALVLSVRPYGEGNALIHMFSEGHGLSRAMARGGASRRQASQWQAGNLVKARFRARLAEQLGHVTAETVRNFSASLMDAPLALAMLASACALADGALPEREAHPELFVALVRFLTQLGIDPEPSLMAEYLRWEQILLSDLGYGLDLSHCAVTGERTGLKYVSPRSGRAVTEAGAGRWKEQLLPLPALFLDAECNGGPQEWRSGLELTGHFLAHAVFGARHRPLPAARERLYGRVRQLCADDLSLLDRKGEAVPKSAP